MVLSGLLIRLPLVICTTLTYAVSWFLPSRRSRLDSMAICVQQIFRKLIVVAFPWVCWSWLVADFIAWMSCHWSFISISTSVVYPYLIMSCILVCVVFAASLPFWMIFSSQYILHLIEIMSFICSVRYHSDFVWLNLNAAIVWIHEFSIWMPSLLTKVCRYRDLSSFWLSSGCQISHEIPLWIGPSHWLRLPLICYSYKELYWFTTVLCKFQDQYRRALGRWLCHYMAHLGCD